MTETTKKPMTAADIFNAVVQRIKDKGAYPENWITRFQRTRTMRFSQPQVCAMSLIKIIAGNLFLVYNTIVRIPG